MSETKQATIEEMDVIFGGSNHVEKGGKLSYCPIRNELSATSTQILGVADVHHATAGTMILLILRMWKSLPPVRSTRKFHELNFAPICISLVGVKLCKGCLSRLKVLCKIV